MALKKMALVTAAAQQRVNGRSPELCGMLTPQQALAALRIASRCPGADAASSQIGHGTPSPRRQLL